MFAFTRGVRLKLPAANEEEAVATVEGALRSWNESTQDPWRHWFPASPDPITEFRETWRKLRTNTLQMALQRAEAVPLRPRIHDSNRNYVRCLSIAFYLQIERGDGPIFLPCHPIGRLLALDPKIVWRYRCFASELGFLVRTARSSGRGRADEFRFSVDLFDRRSGEQLATQSCVAPATHESPEKAYLNKTLAQESHERSCVALPATQSCVAPATKKKPASEPYIPTAAETAVILQQHFQWHYGRKA